jgi:hypothetical protein
MLVEELLQRRTCGGSSLDDRQIPAATRRSAMTADGRTLRRREVELAMPRATVLDGGAHRATVGAEHR